MPDQLLGKMVLPVMHMQPLLLLLLLLDLACKTEDSHPFG
jgi:hypothetical protein